MKLSYKTSLLVVVLALVTSISKAVADDDEFCVKTDDGEFECTDSTVSHWKDVIITDEVLEFLKKRGVNLSGLNLEILLHYLDKNDDHSVTQEELDDAAEETPLKMIERSLEKFAKLDADEDATLSQKEMEEFTNPDNIREMNIMTYFSTISQFAPDLGTALLPVLTMGFWTPKEFKKIMVETTKMFTVNDEDENGSLSKVEFVNAIRNSGSELTDKIPESNMDNLFDLLDKNKDGDISFLEFQAVVPKAKASLDVTLENIFKTGDLDGDGFWSQTELGDHMYKLIKRAGGVPPSEDEIEDTFSRLDTDEDGQINLEELQNVKAEIERIQTSKALQGFMELDTDKDGRLSKDEMKPMIDMMEKSTKREINLDLFMSMLDTNGNGFIETIELEKMVKTMVNPPTSPI